MIDDKEIDIAARAQALSKHVNETAYFQLRSIEDFKDGAHWAINEFLRDLWHPASEIPAKPNTAILAKAVHDTHENPLFHYSFYYIIYAPPGDKYSKKHSELWNERNSILGTSEWLYIDDLIQKKGGKQ